MAIFLHSASSVRISGGNNDKRDDDYTLPEPAVSYQHWWRDLGIEQKYDQGYYTVRTQPLSRAFMSHGGLITKLMLVTDMSYFRVVWSARQMRDPSRALGIRSPSSIAPSKL